MTHVSLCSVKIEKKSEGKGRDKRLRICRKKVAAETGSADGVDLDARGVRKDAVKEDGVAADARARVADGGGLRVDERGEQPAQLERLVAARDAEPPHVVVQEPASHHLWQCLQQQLHLLVIPQCKSSHCSFCFSLLLVHSFIRSLDTHEKKKVFFFCL